jgi:hypothetical protein
MSKRKPILPKGPNRPPAPRPSAGQVMAPSPGWGPEQGLRSAIQKFAFQSRFNDDFHVALPQFFGEEATRNSTLVADEEDIPAFQEWYFFDYLTEAGEPIVAIFAREDGSKLPARERELLDLWRHWNRYRLLEVQEVMPGIGIKVTDLLSGENLEVHDRSASRNLTRWTIFLSRPLYTDRLHFTGAGVVLPPTKKGSIMAYAQKLWADFRAQYPEATLDQFYQRRGLDLYHFMKHKGEERPIYVTPEMHPLEICTARYRVRDGKVVARLLKDAEEFNYAGPSSDKPNSMHFNWLLRGRSYIPEAPRPDGETFTYETYWFAEPNTPRYLSLGDVNLWPDRLELSCLSQVRLAAGKALLQELLAPLIRHHRDRVEPIDDFIAKQAQRPTRPERNSVPPEIAAASQEEMMREQRHRLLDEPHEKLGGKTAREAVHDPAYRDDVIELLKIAEFIEDSKRKAGEAWLNVDEMRRELGVS